MCFEPQVDHSAEELDVALGVDSKDIAERMSPIISEFFTDDDAKPSMIAEKMLQEFSNKELVFVAAGATIDKLASDPKMQMLMKLKAIFAGE